MLRRGKRRRSLPAWFLSAVRVLPGKDDIYGLEWGNPDAYAPLRHVRDHFLRPYVSPQTTVVEIGPGGGRWTRYMAAAKQIYAVDYHQELLDELKSNIASDNMIFVKNDGDNFPGIPSASVDFVFSFGTFVHLDRDIIDRYLYNLKPLLKPEANVVLHYADKSKLLAKINRSFSDNDRDRMRKLVLSHGYSVYEEDWKTTWGSCLVRFGPQNRAA
jgi:cyclopropane fatty-acyl-phospholipid synthase-like methyltransferase